MTQGRFVSRAGVSCLLMARDGKTARRVPAGQEAHTRQPVPRPDGDGPLPSSDDPVSYTYTTDLAAIRAVVHRYAIQAGLTEARAIDLTLAVSEVAANTVKHAKSPSLKYGDLACLTGHWPPASADGQREVDGTGFGQPGLDRVPVQRRPGSRPGQWCTYMTRDRPMRAVGRRRLAGEPADG